MARITPLGWRQAIETYPEEALVEGDHNMAGGLVDILDRNR